jgi:hypothetical protein
MGSSGTPILDEKKAYAVAENNRYGRCRHAAEGMHEAMSGGRIRRNIERWFQHARHNRLRRSS